ncbi:RND family efflux transporter MFP subunit [Caballeronia peredens]|uniref:efflux RND transporter periplasmic adaptor subunit n=1 Tax=Caballeronia sp. LZ029 TaxID=3038564 RepID=UPI00074BC5C6|nr:efflux RND transporter periplasmic adaptor subunit [Caballeronia sp. LZ029]MDR5743567.1 efflux RND transporter periplasmic adaptor subunit [Caballeronia sp. LZ029]SAL75539.1 RND family efflux transporter MFP subunit [Caballeronia peredens]
MPRKKLIAITAAAIGVSITLAVLATTLKSKETNAAAEAASEKNGSDAGEATGQHGGKVLKAGDLTLEVVLSEKPNDARLILYPSAGGKPIQGGVTATAKLNRAQGTSETIGFVESGNKLTSELAIAKPHVFDSTLNVSWNGKPTTFAFALADGAIPLDGQQMQRAGIGLSNSGPAQIASTIQVPGEVRFNEDRTAHVVPRVSGIVEQVAVSVGEKVQKGQVLAVIASTDLADRRSELLTAERRLSAAKTAYQREKTLWEERISAEQDYLQAQVQLREAEIAAQNARQKLVALNATPNGGALNRYDLRAPFAGTIVEKHITPGEAVAAEANIFTLSDLSTVWAEMAVPAQHLNDVRVGRDAIVKAAAFDSTAQGKISYVGALLGEQTRSAPARVVLPNPDGAWRPGMFVNVFVNAGEQGVPVAVASDALQDIDGSPAVFIATPKGFVAQPIKTGRKDDRVVEVVSGLSAGQQYVASNSFVLKAELGKGSAEHE